ncbi:MAG: accessory factor UbiK family protein [Cellvibrionaceae bacterium]
MTRQPFEDLFDRASSFLGGAGPELERRVKLMVHSALTRMDLVTREEFDAQTKVLQYTRERLEALERQLAELEKDNQ